MNTVYGGFDILTEDERVWEWTGQKMREAVHANAGGPPQGSEYKPVAEWEINTLDTALDHEDMTEPALEIYERAIQTSIVKFREVATVACAAYYLACRREQLPVTQRTIVKHGHSTSTKLGRLVTDLQRELDLVVLPPPPETFLPAIRTALDLPEAIEEDARTLLEESLEADPALVSGRSPAGIAAGTLYTACRRSDHRRTQQAIADAADADVETLRAVYHRQTELATPDASTD